MAKKLKATFQVTVIYCSGEKLLLNCTAPDIAHRVAMVANRMPGIESAHYDSMGHALHSEVMEALETVAAFSPRVSDAIGFLEDNKNHPTIRPSYKI